MRDASFVHCTTEDEASHVRGKYPGVDVRVVPNGLDLERFDSVQGGERFRQQWLGGWEGPVLTCVGRLSHKKGLDVLIDALAIMSEQRSDLRLAIVGSRRRRTHTGSPAAGARLGLGRRVVFTGPLYGYEQLAALDATDVWVLASRGENFGNAVVEAMAAGCPVVVSPEVGVAEAVRKADAGIVAAAEPQALAAAIERLLASPERRPRSRARGRELVGQFDWSRIAPKMTDYFEECAARSQSTPVTIA